MEKNWAVTNLLSSSNFSTRVLHIWECHPQLWWVLDSDQMVDKQHQWSQERILSSGISWLVEETWFFHHLTRCLLHRDIIRGLHLLYILQHQVWTPISECTRRIPTFRVPLFLVSPKEWCHRTSHLTIQCLQVTSLPTHHLALKWTRFFPLRSNSSLQSKRHLLLQQDLQRIMEDNQQTMLLKTKKMSRLHISCSRWYLLGVMINILNSTIHLCFKMVLTYSLTLLFLTWCTTR